MKNKKLTEMTNEELLNTAKTLKVMTYMLTGMVVLLFIVTIILAIKKGFSALNVVGIALIPILVINFNTLKEMKKEIKARNLS